MYMSKKWGALLLCMFLLTACTTSNSVEESNAVTQQEVVTSEEVGEIFPESSIRQMTALDISSWQLYSKATEPHIREQAVAEIYKRNRLVVGTDFDKLNDVEQYNVTLLTELPQWDPEDNSQLYETRKLHHANYTAYERNEKVVVDLDGDGVEEKITYRIKEDESGSKGYELQVNTTTVFAEGNQFMDTFAIVDSNTQDSYKEIAIGDTGPSNDEVTTFYRYKEGKLIELGKIEGLFTDGQGIDGSGQILSRTRSMTLPTWWLNIPYTLVEDSFKAQEGTYNGYGGQVMTIIDLKVYEANNQEAVSYFLPKYSVLDIIGGDNKNWIQIKTQDEKTHWFYIDEDNYIEGTEAYTWDVFLGLWFAD